MNSRKFILNKLQQNAGKNSNRPPVIERDITIYKDYPDQRTLEATFIQNFEKLNGEVLLCNNSKIAAEKLTTLLADFDSKKCIAHSSQTINSLINQKITLTDCFQILPPTNFHSSELSLFEVGITNVDFLVARTGSLVLNSLSCGGRRLSVLPPVHIVLAQTTQIVFSLEDVFNNNFIQNRWSYATIISGPSRTSDIEKQLVLGAHGPKKLILILIK